MKGKRQEIAKRKWQITAEISAEITSEVTAEIAGELSKMQKTTH